MTGKMAYRKWDVSWSWSWALLVGLGWEHRTLGIALGPLGIYIRRVWGYR